MSEVMRAARPKLASGAAVYVAQRCIGISQPAQATDVTAFRLPRDSFNARNEPEPVLPAIHNIAESVLRISAGAFRPER